MQHLSDILKSLILIVLILVCTSGKAQVIMQAKLIDSISGAPVSFATISLFKKDLKRPLQNSISAVDGSFRIIVKDTGSFKIVVTHTAYKQISLSANQPLPAAILLTPSIKNSTAVTITAAARPLVEKIEDKLIYNVESDISLEGQMATDALRKTPFISVDADGNILLKGQSNFKILLNGKESALFTKAPAEALRSFPAGMIRKIEVITNPSSKYDAEGVAGIINIITQKKLAGYNATVGLSYNSLHLGSANTTVNIKKGKLGFAGFFSLSHVDNPPSNRINIIASLHPQIYSQNKLAGTYFNRFFSHNGNVELSMDIDSLQIVSGYSNFGSSKGGLYQHRNLTLTGIRGIYETESLYIDTNRFSYPFADMGIDYIRIFKNHPVKEWSVKNNYEFSHDITLNNSDQNNDIKNRFVLNDNRSDNNQTTLQSDLVLPVKPGQRLELGIKTILRQASADYSSLYRFNKSDRYVPDTNNTNRFIYSQHVFGAYFLYAFKVSRWDLRFGARIEHTEVKGDFVSNASSVKQNYTNVIPSFYASTKLKQKQDLSFSYSKRLHRPYIWDLNPFVNNTDSLNISYGNPHLAAELTHSFEIGYSYFKKATNVNIRLSENYCNNQITKYFLFNNETGVTANYPDNIGRNLYTGVNGNFSTKFFNKWSVSINTGAQYNIIKNTKNPKQVNKGISGNGTVTNTIEVNKQLVFSASAGFVQSPILLQGKYTSFKNYSTNIAYKMLAGKLRLTITAANFLNRYISYRNIFKDENFIRTTITQYNSRSIGISLRWSFGKLTASTSRKRGIINDDIQK